MEELLQQVTNGLAVGGVYALVALGYTMVYGVLRLINFAHGELFTLGAYLGFSFLASSFLGGRLGSGGGLVVYCLTLTTAIVDWLMSLDPHWFSSIYGVYALGGQGISTLAFVIHAAFQHHEVIAVGWVCSPVHRGIVQRGQGRGRIGMVVGTVHTKAHHHRVDIVISDRQITIGGGWYILCGAKAIMVLVLRHHNAILFQLHRAHEELHRCEADGVARNIRIGAVQIKVRSAVPMEAVVHT